MKIGYIISNDGISITIDGITKTIARHALNYQMVKKALIEEDSALLKQAIDSEGFIGSITQGKVSYENGKLKFKGYDIAPSIAKKLTAILNEGIPAIPWLKFVDRLVSNPSKRCLDNLYEFLDHKGMPITQTGTCLGYKGVSDDYYSMSGNADTIVLQGKVNSDFQIYNGIGEIIELARLSVDDNPANGCSYGLHIGSFDYADAWAGSDGKLMLVEFDPKDAVSVPSDCEFQKLRVTKYEVINEITDNRNFLDRPVYNLDEDEDGNMSIHPLSQPQMDTAVKSVKEYSRALDVPIALELIARENDISIFDLTTALMNEGFEIDWSNMDNPKAYKADNN